VAARGATKDSLVRASQLKGAQEQLGNADARNQALKDKLEKLDSKVKAVEACIAGQGLTQMPNGAYELPEIPQFESEAVRLFNGWSTRIESWLPAGSLKYVFKAVQKLKQIDNVFRMNVIAVGPRVASQVVADTRPACSLPSPLRNADPLIQCVTFALADGNVVTYPVSLAAFRELMSMNGTQRISANLLAQQLSRLHSIDLKDYKVNTTDNTLVAAATQFYYLLYRSRTLPNFQLWGTQIEDEAFDESMLLDTESAKSGSLPLVVPSQILSSAVAVVAILLGVLQCRLIWEVGILTWHYPWLTLILCSMLPAALFVGLAQHCPRYVLEHCVDFALLCAYGYGQIWFLCLMMSCWDLKRGWLKHTILSLVAMSCGVFSTFTQFCLCGTIAVSLFPSVRLILPTSISVSSIRERMLSKHTPDPSSRQLSTKYSIPTLLLVVILLSMCLWLIGPLFFTTAFIVPEPPISPMTLNPSSLLFHLESLKHVSCNFITTWLLNSVEVPKLLWATFGRLYQTSASALSSDRVSGFLGVACREICAHHLETLLPTLCSGCSLPSSKVSVWTAWWKVTMAFFVALVLTVLALFLTCPSSPNSVSAQSAKPALTWAQRASASSTLTTKSKPTSQTLVIALLPPAGHIAP
jgi:hypothetical protein